MKLKFINPKLDKTKLKKFMLQIALEKLVLEGNYASLNSAKTSIYLQAKREYNKRQ